MKKWKRGGPLWTKEEKVSIRGGLKSTKGLNFKVNKSYKIKVKRGRKPKLNLSQRKRLAELYLEGYSPKELSNFFNISEMTVYRVVNSYVKENFSGNDFDEVFEKVKERLWS